jgi:hypothetical protein
MKGGAYHIGQSVQLRGGSMDMWNIQDMTPEFVTITNDQGDINVVDINDILPYQMGMNGMAMNGMDMNQMDMNQMDMNQMGMNGMAMNGMNGMGSANKPMFPSEMKPPDVNVVVVTGDKNEINGLTSNNKANTSDNKQNHDNDNDHISQDKKEKEKKGGDNTNRNDNTSRNNSFLDNNPIIDFTKSFFIKKMG